MYCIYSVAIIYLDARAGSTVLGLTPRDGRWSVFLARDQHNRKSRCAAAIDPGLGTSPSLTHVFGIFHYIIYDCFKDSNLSLRVISSTIILYILPTSMLGPPLTNSFSPLVLVATAWH